MMYQAFHLLVQRNLLKSISSFYYPTKPFHYSRQRHPERKPVLSIETSFNNHNRQSIHDNFSIQLPLIETHHPRVIFLNFCYRRQCCIFLSQNQEIPRRERQ